MKWFIGLALLVVSNVSHSGMSEWLFGNNNFYECILYEMPDAENDQEANEIHKQCKQDYPLSIPLVRQHSYLDVQSSTQCLKEFVEQTDSPIARGWIKQACYKVYFRK